MCYPTSKIYRAMNITGGRKREEEREEGERREREGEREERWRERGRRGRERKREKECINSIHCSIVLTIHFLLQSLLACR